MKKEKVNVICIKWGTKYSNVDVNRIYNMVLRNTNFNVNFHCLTDNSEGFNKNIIASPLPKMNMDMNECKYVYRKEAGLCDNNLGNLNG